MRAVVGGKCDFELISTASPLGISAAVNIRVVYFIKIHIQIRTLTISVCKTTLDRLSS